jgi:hypothetical protein
MGLVKKIITICFLIFILYTIFFSFSQINKFVENDEHAAEMLSYEISKYAKKNNIKLVEAYKEKINISEELKDSNLQDYILRNVDNWKLNKIIYLITQAKLNADFSYFSIFFSIVISAIIFIKSSVVNKNILFSYLYSVLFFICTLNLPISMSGYMHFGISSLSVLLITILLTNKISLINYLFISILISLLIFNLYPPPIIFSFLIIFSFFIFKFYERTENLLKNIILLITFIIIFYFIFLFIFQIFFTNDYDNNVYLHANEEGLYKSSFIIFFYNFFIFLKSIFIPISLEKYKIYFTHMEHLVNYSIIFPIIFLLVFLFFFLDLKKKTFIHLSIILYLVFLFFINIQHRYLYILLPVIIYHSLYIFNRFSSSVINKINIFIIFSILINIILLSNFFYNDRNRYNNFISSKLEILKDHNNIILQNNLKFTQILSLHNSLNNPSSKIYNLPKNKNIKSYDNFISTQLTKGSSIFVLSVSNFYPSAPDDWNNDNDEWIDFDFYFPNLIPTFILNNNKKVYYRLYELKDNNYCWLSNNNNIININKNTPLLYINNISILNSIFKINNPKLIKESKVLLVNNNLRVFMKIEGKSFKIQDKKKSLFLKELFVKTFNTKAQRIFINSKKENFRNVINQIDYNNLLEEIEINNSSSNIYTIYLNITLNKKLNFSEVIKKNYKYAYLQCKK